MQLSKMDVFEVDAWAIRSLMSGTYIRVRKADCPSVFEKGAFVAFTALSRVRTHTRQVVSPQ